MSGVTSEIVAFLEAVRREDARLLSSLELPPGPITGGTVLLLLRRLKAPTLDHLNRQIRAAVQATRNCLAESTLKIPRYPRTGRGRRS